MKCNCRGFTHEENPPLVALVFHQLFQAIYKLSKAWWRASLKRFDSNQEDMHTTNYPTLAWQNRPDFATPPMTSEKRAQKFHNDDASLPGSGYSASDWLNQISLAARPIRSTSQIRVATRHHYGISVLVSQTSFSGETSGGVTKCWLFSQARNTEAHP